jgi:hypothetical protein
VEVDAGEVPPLSHLGGGRLLGRPARLGPSSSSVSELIISQATISSAGAVACDGTMPISGARNMNGKNRKPVITLTQPVLPPTATPDADSM